MDAHTYRDHMSLLSYEPLIVFVTGAAFSEVAPGLRGVDILADAFGEDCHFLIQPWWSLLTPDSGRIVAEARQHFATRLGHCKLTICCAQPEEHAIFARDGVDYIDISHNIFVNETIFDIRPDHETKYTDKKTKHPYQKTKYLAVLNARFDTFKRHELAYKVENCALIYSRYGQQADSLYERVRANMPTATFMNGNPLDQSYRSLDHEAIATVINQSSVGLSLSALEGANFASIEYLVSGIPIVSTESIGGRHMFFDDFSSRIVPPDADAVADAVAELAARKIDRRAIRAAAMAKVLAGRARLADFISNVQARAGKAPTGPREIERVRYGFGGMCHQSPADLVREREQALAARAEC